jgi:EAL domain-containing protein (putative c-di-GMP-specific phosphodiesterase class I)
VGGRFPAALKRGAAALDDLLGSTDWLSSLPATGIKIDGSFIRDSLTNARSASSVQGIVQRAKHFRLESGAEFGESAGAAQRRRRLGVDDGQGDIFAKPIPLKQVLGSVEQAQLSPLPEVMPLRWR